MKDAVISGSKRQVAEVVLTRLRRGWQLGRHLGWSWLAYRAWYAADQRSGLLARRLPQRAWDAVRLRQLLRDPAQADPERYLALRGREEVRFLFDPAQLPVYAPMLSSWQSDLGGVEQTAERLERGELRYFEHLWLEVGAPPRWQRHPLTGRDLPETAHWSRLGDFNFGDIKLVWEPSRFAFAYDLVRAYWRTGREQHAELFWRLLEDWRAHNSPNSGPNWKCGQEASLRLMAWCFALYGFWQARATTATRVVMLAEMVAATGARVEGNLSYALSQRNNHGISEAVGLWTAGVLFPELRDAERWRDVGRRAFERQMRELFDDDGAFSQHSHNYTRVALHACLWALRLAERNEQPPFAPWVRERVLRAGELLYQLQDPSSGRLPRYGQNDGALILPLTACASDDFRPVIQSVHQLGGGSRCYPSGPWEEEQLWLLGPDAALAPIDERERHDLRADRGGYYTLRSPSGFAATRCGRFRHRPAQADLLHVDLWWRGLNIALDPGTYSYNAAEPWANPLARTVFHNTVTVDGCDQMDRAGRFLWLPWIKGSIYAAPQRSPGGQLGYWEGGHDGYARRRPAVEYRRAIVRLPDDVWLVVDALRSAKPHDLRLHWLLGDWPHDRDGDETIRLHTPSGPYTVRLAVLGAPARYDLVRADPQSARGWYAPHYMAREPALSFAAQLHAAEATFVSCFGAVQLSSVFAAGRWQLRAPSWSAAIELGTVRTAPSVRRVVVQGAVEDVLEVIACTPC